jgi:hypothetical protein
MPDPELLKALLTLLSPITPTCDRCGGNAGYQIRLFGDISGTLCRRCGDEWDELLTTSPTWAALEKMDARDSYYRGLATAGSPPGEQEWLELRQLETHVKRQARQLAAVFLERRKLG